VQGGVAQQPLDRRAVETGAIDGRGPGAARRPEALDVEDEVDVGAVAACPPGPLVVEEESADVAEGVGAAGGRAAGRFVVGVGGLGDAERGGEQFAGFGAEVGVEAPPASQGARQVQAVGSVGLGVAVRGGAVRPRPHGGDDIPHRQVGQRGQQPSLVVGEQTDRVGVEVAGDGLDLAGR
jgi:hypothetical protein